MLKENQCESQEVFIKVETSSLTKEECLSPYNNNLSNNVEPDIDFPIENQGNVTYWNWYKNFYANKYWI